ncbi:PREDICTED: uncharacterized protein LOC108380439 [Rhagoletis zephyria]|uniref:uncharacterized protein LOC108380439 n=1 Tax=Rhagoletis zephyria TaxID=28612 RepID=UPI000811577B|nr:PREDICTED: uncharacterized protein LOC108380439 [Rhagoletis zephyria]
MLLLGHPVYERSLLKRELQNCALLNEMSVQFESTNIPVLILGDSAFCLSRHIMKPFPFHLNHTTAQKVFNYRLLKCRRVIENVFGHLKARFRRIGKGIDNGVQNTNSVIKACCALHNFLVEEKDELFTSWFHEQRINDRDRKYPNHSTYLTNNGNEAEGIRNTLSLYFARAFDEDGKSDGNSGDNGESNETTEVDGEGVGSGTTIGAWVDIS